MSYRKSQTNTNLSFFIFENFRYFLYLLVKTNNQQLIFIKIVTSGILKQKNANTVKVEVKIQKP